MSTIKQSAVIAAILGVAAGLVGGCSEGAPVDLAYIRPAKFEIPAKVKRLAVAEFVSKETNESGLGAMNPLLAARLGRGQASDTAWGSVAADKLGDGLDRCNREFKRYELVDRRNLSKILGEKDIRIMTSTDAGKVGRIADVQAIIYGTVVVKSIDEMAQKMVFNAMAMTMMPKFYTKRYVYVCVNLTMDDVETSKTLLTRTLTQEFDSERSSKGVASVLGFSSDNPEPVGQTVNKVLDVCVQEFIQEISAHRVNIQDRLEIGKGALVARGNTLAAVREYVEALECYQKAFAEAPDDDGAAFNAGLMCEATGNLSKADEYYTKAFSLSAKEKYAKARKRVRDETQAKRQVKAEVSAVLPK